MDASGELSPAFFAAHELGKGRKGLTFCRTESSKLAIYTQQCHSWYEYAIKVAKKVNCKILGSVAMLFELECFSRHYTCDCDQNDDDMIQNQLNEECSISHVTVKISSIQGEGANDDKGLFAGDTLLPKGTALDYFGYGKCMLKSEVSQLRSDDNNGKERFAELCSVFVERPDDIICIRGCKSCPATYAQHVDGGDRSRFAERVNAKLVPNPLWNGTSQPFSKYNSTGFYVPALQLILTKDVKAGQEIFFDYGEEFWINSDGTRMHYNVPPLRVNSTTNTDSSDSDVSLPASRAAVVAKRREGLRPKQAQRLGNVESNLQFSDNAEPEIDDFNLIHCDICKKWRKYPSNITNEELPDQWYPPKIVCLYD